MELKDFKAGEYVTLIHHQSGRFIFQEVGGGETPGFIGESSLRFGKYGFFANSYGKEDIYRKSTPEEIHWFEECKKIGKYVPLKEALKTFYKIETYNVWN